MRELARDALAVVRAGLALGNEVFAAEGGIFVRNRHLPALRDANHVSQPTATTAGAVDALLARADREFAGSPHRRVDCDDTTPPAVESRLARDHAFGRREVLVMVVDGPLRRAAPPHVVAPVADAGGWQRLERLQEASWAEAVAGLVPAPDGGVRAQIAAARRAKVPPVRYWLAWMAGEPVGYFSAWAGPRGVGLVEDLFVLPAARGQGVATALVHACVGDCRAGGAGPVALTADPTDTPRRMYAALGFRVVARRREHLRTL
jgi:GNAT superfamily N-acetyltransferase